MVSNSDLMLIEAVGDGLLKPVPKRLWSREQLLGRFLAEVADRSQRAYRAFFFVASTSVPVEITAVVSWPG